MRYPRVIIQYCSKCKWQNRAIWYLTEILQTFDGVVQEVSLQPVVDQPGIFQVSVQKENESEVIIYRRRFKNEELARKYGDADQKAPYYYDGFPDSKLLKILLKEVLDSSVTLGHAEKYSNTALLGQERNDTCRNCVSEDS